MNQYYGGRCGQCGTYFSSYEPTSICMACAIKKAKNTYVGGSEFFGTCKPKVVKHQWIVENPGVKPFLTVEFYSADEASFLFNRATSLKPATWTATEFSS